MPTTYTPAWGGAAACLPPLRYAIFLPHRGTYLRQIDTLARRFRFTADKASAYVLPDPEARKVGSELARVAREPVELRLWEVTP
jgi:hypothetical protein